MKKEQSRIKTMTEIAMFAAVLAVLSIVRIPLPSGIPITLQTFAVALCGYVLGWKKGAAAVILYLLIGLIGLPVFSGMRGGMEVLGGPAGGFLLGFPVTAALCGIRPEQSGRFGSIVRGFAGIACCHLTGTIQFAVITGRTLPEAFLTASLLYLGKDLISAVGAYFLAAVLRKTLKQVKTS